MFQVHTDKMRVYALNCVTPAQPPEIFYRADSMPRPYDVCSTSNSGVDEALLPALGSLDKRMDDS